MSDSVYERGRPGRPRIDTAEAERKLLRLIAAGHNRTAIALIAREAGGGAKAVAARERTLRRRRAKLFGQNSKLNGQKSSTPEA